MERLPCKSADCKNTVQVATAKDTGGYCMPCVQKRQRAEREDFIRKNRKDVNPYDGVSDPAEVLKIMLAPKKHDPLVRLLPHPRSAEELCSELSDGQISKLIDHAIGLHEVGNEDDADIFALILAAFTDANIDRLQEHLVSIARFYPGVVFHGASTEVEDDLISALADNNRLQTNHLLTALAWSGSERIISMFSDWRRNPPSWSSVLHVRPEEYSKEAGWELDGEKRRDLYFRECYPLLKQTDTSASSDSVIAGHPDKCRWCGRPLTALFEFDLSDPQLAFIKVDQRKVSIAACDSCAAFGPFFTTIDRTGKSSWHPKNARPNYLPEDGAGWPRLPEKVLSKSVAPRRPFHAAHQFLPTTFSQVGGHPTWIQDAEFPKCLDCKRTMLFVAQLSHEDIEPGEGIFYSFVCFECMNGATTYQQT